jgi:hypothetical protein
VSDTPSGRDAAPNPGQDEIEPIQYPIGHVLGILDTEDQTTCAVEALVNGGYLESEVHLGRGPETLERSEAGTGRGGIQDWAIRFFERLGVRNAESEMKQGYEQALREGRIVIAVLTPTDERKDRAAQMLQDCGAHFINFYGRLNVERILR